MDFGELGTGENTGITYDWKLYYSLPALIIWAVLALAVVTVKSNRHMRVLAVLAPLIILVVAWSAVGNLLGISGLSRQMFGIMFYSAIAGVSMIWLLSDKLSRLHCALRPFAAVGILGLACLAGAIGQGLTEGMVIIQLAIIETVLLLALVISLILAAVLCFKRYGRARYSLWLLATTTGACLLGMLLVGLFVVLGPMGPDNVSIEQVKEMMFQTFLAGLAIAAFLYAIQIVFIAFTLSTPFYRERFCKCLGLRPAGVGVTPPDSSVQTEPPQLPQKQIDPE